MSRREKLGKIIIVERVLKILKYFLRVRFFKGGR